MAVSDNIRRLRMGAGLTQEELAARLGVARSTITQWERGWAQPRMGMVQKLADAFGTTASEIVAEEGAPQAEAVPATVELVDVRGAAGGERGGAGAAGGVRGRGGAGERVEVPVSLVRRHPSLLATVIWDDSIDRVAPKGFVAAFDPDLPPANGQLALVEAAGQVLVRRWYKGGDTLMLVADSHSAHADVVVAQGEPSRVLGTVVWVQPLYELL